jgi:phosphoglucan,water dikinase
MFEYGRIRIGNQTAFFVMPLLLPFEYAVAHGFDAFEWLPDKKGPGMGWTVDDIPPETRAMIRKTASEKDISLSVHASIRSAPLKIKGSEVFQRDVEFAREVGAVLFNIHLDPDEGIDSFVRSITPLAEDLSRTGMKLSIENTPEAAPRDFNQFFRHLADIRFPHISSVGMCLDIGHANLCDFTRNDYLKYIDLLAPEVPIIHLHMHENYGDFDSHLPVFTGPAGKDPAGIKGLVERMKKRKFSGTVILEQWPQPPGLLDTARKGILEMFGISNESYDEGSPDFADRIVKANNQFLSWRKRLEWVLNSIANKRSPGLDQLVYIAIYLHFIGTGEIRCGEDGGHYRPSNHARISQKIYSLLSKIANLENIFIIRKIYPWLPSFDSAFIRAEPLTLIRDIAHRNDIPQDLKKEIKLTLQNKLHRSAGPEDLATSEALLQRITAPGASFPPAFVKEFRRFHGELKEFFNARSLDEKLKAFMRKANASEKALVRDFLQSKQKAADTYEEVSAVLRLLTELRSRLTEKLTGYTGTEEHELQLLDIGLEDFSFVLLSRLINHLDSLKKAMPWLPALDSLSLSVRNLRLSGFDAEECLALESELNAWSGRFDSRDRDQLLRIKATVDRCLRLAEVYCGKILTLFPERVKRLGRSLGVAEESVKLFAESDIRRHPVFQLSKLAGILLKKIRSLATLPPWEVIVPGKVSGRAIAAPDMYHLSDVFGEPVIALLDKIEGEEEVPFWVKGVIVAHQTPLLSHLAVRSRQRRLVFLSCDDPECFSELKYFDGKNVTLDVSAEKFDLRVYHPGDNTPGDNRGVKISTECPAVPRMSPSAGRSVLPLDQVTPETGGNKAFGAKRLEEFSRRKESGFRTPAGVVLPFGVMEESLASSPAMEKEYRSLVDELNVLSGDDLNRALRKLKDIVISLQVPHEVLRTVMKCFREDERLMVRSSSNCEDGQSISGAGVYDSVANIAPSDVSQAVRAVWASLWNGSAIAERKNAGISHEKVSMAVLVQKMVVPELSFIMHTMNPVNRNRAEIYIELAVGLGETLASAEIPGGPYRMVFEKDSRRVRMLAFSSFSDAAWPDEKGGTVRKTVDYSLIGFSRNATYRKRLGNRIGATGLFVEGVMGSPQDIEGLVSEDTVYLLQCRPQHGVK